MATKKVSLIRILAFSAPSLPLAALGLPAAVHLPNYYSSYVGLPLAVVGQIFMLARIFDIFVDFGLGIWMDKVKTPIGRFTPFLLAGAPIMAYFAYMLFAGKTGASWQYLFINLVATYIGFSMCMLAQLGVGASLSDDYDERSRIFGFWQIGNIVGMLVVLALPVIIESQGFPQHIGVQAMGIFIAIAMPAGALISWFFAKEEMHHLPTKHQSLREIWAMFKLASFRSLAISDLVISFALGVNGALFMFFLKDIKGYATQASMMFFIYFLSGLICTPIWTHLAKKLGKHIAFGAACIFLIIAQILYLFIPSNNFPIAISLVVIAGMVYAAPILLLRAMVGDAGDEDKLVNEDDRTGMLFATLTFTSKFGYALSVGITYILLQWFNYDPKLGAANQPSAIIGMEALFAILPIAGYVIVAYLMFKYPLNSARVAEVQEKLKQKNAN